MVLVEGTQIVLVECRGKVPPRVPMNSSKSLTESLGSKKEEFGALCIQPDGFRGEIGDDRYCANVHFLEVVATWSEVRTPLKEPVT